MSNPTAFEIRIGRLALEEGLVTPAQINECVREQEYRDARIGELLVEKGYISQSRLDALLIEQKRRKKMIEDGTYPVAAADEAPKLSEEDFVAILRRENLVGQMGIQECLKIQERHEKETGERKSIARLLIELHYLTREEIQDVINRHTGE